MIDRKFYGRIRGKSLKKKQAERMEDLLPSLQINLPENDTNILLNTFFTKQAPIWLEIGFGGGEHLANIALNNNEVNFIGSEVYLNGVASLLRHIDEGDINNIRIYPNDVRDLLDRLPNHCLDRAYLLYPDPWPKTRHKERRFTNPDNLKTLARLLKPGAELRIASDIDDYITYTLNNLSKLGEFSRLPLDIHTPWDGWLSTRYEAKAIRENRTPNYLIFVRNEIINN